MAIRVWSRPRSHRLYTFFTARQILHNKFPHYRSTKFNSGSVIYCQITILSSFYHLKIVSAYFSIIKFHVQIYSTVSLGSPVACLLQRFFTKTSREGEREGGGRERVNFSTSKIKDQSITPYVTTITIVGNQNMNYHVPYYRIDIIFQLIYNCCIR